MWLPGWRASECSPVQVISQMFSTIHTVTHTQSLSGNHGCHDLAQQAFSAFFPMGPLHAFSVPARLTYPASLPYRHPPLPRFSDFLLALCSLPRSVFPPASLLVQILLVLHGLPWRLLLRRVPYLVSPQRLGFIRPSLIVLIVFCFGFNLFICVCLTSSPRCHSSRAEPMWNHL